MTQSPGAIESKINAVTSGWSENAADATFSGMTVSQFKTKVKPSLDARARIADLEAQLAAARIVRANADAASQETVLQVVNSVKGDSEYGEDSALYNVNNTAVVGTNDPQQPIPTLPPYYALAYIMRVQ
ncbi:MAG: hypothetical protein L0Z50_10550 [Verrucomicrobiales bacterium]|nr:hypothetical protein [Verrucomicrobiales bacterium]